MRRKGILSVFMSLFLVVAFAGMAFAAQNVFQKTTVPDIPKSDCYQVGTQTLEFDNATKLTNGDVIRFSLSNNTTLCKSFNYYLRLHDGLLAADAALPASTSALPVTATTAAGSTMTLAGAAAGAAKDYGFIVQGTAGSQTYTLTLAERVKATGVTNTTTAFTLTYGESVAGSKLIVKLFDEKFLTPYFWKNSRTAAAPTVSAYAADSAGTILLAAGYTAMIAEDNVLCANTSSTAFTNEYLMSTPNSLPSTLGNPLVFSGDYTVAHVVSSMTVTPYTCKGDVAGHITMPATQATCAAFDVEGVGGQWCVDHTSSQYILQSSAPFEETTYTVTAEILVNGATGEHGVYWSNVAPAANSYTTSSLACAGAGTVALTPSYFKADGSTAVPVVPVVACNTVASSAKAVRFTTLPYHMGVTDGTKSYMYIDLPSFNWNSSEIAEGDIVSVRVTVAKVTCGSLGTTTFTVGTFGCSGTGVANTVFPYFTRLNADPTWWNGIVIVNNGSNAGTANLTAYEQDGSRATATVSVAANSMFVDLVENIAWTPVGGATLGGSPSYISVESNFTSIHGFGMIANPTSGESMGYLSEP
jgi:hypothetical protein